MDRVVRKCVKCGNIGLYSTNPTAIHGANGCNGNTIKCNISEKEFDIMCEIANDNDFFQAMIDLKEKDPIEFQLKMSQFRTQVQQQKQIKRVNLEAGSDAIKCPTCNSRKVRRISGMAKMAGAATLGIFSKAVRSQFQCDNCGYKW